METTTPGGCVCGAVRFEVTPPFKAFQYCHCSRCQKKTGSAHVANIFVAVDQFRWQSGEDRVQRFELPEAKYWCSAFCTTCGSSMPWLSRTKTSMIVPAGALDEDPKERPTQSVYFASRAPWYVPPSELPAHDTYPKG